jgi:5-methylcytosine-specific restriction endonuclease McrA
MTSRIGEKKWGEIKMFYGHQCLDCKRYEPEIILTLDHVVPLSQGGKDSPENIQPLCGVCNQAKGNRTVDYR